ncbi:50S ribosomal protein L4 [Candidatus Altiarchaeota archaeon]
MAKIYTTQGKVKGDLKLPEVFQTAYRPDLIQRTVVAEQSQTRQTYATDVAAGLRTSADYFGSRRRSYRQTINRARSRIPREKPGGGGLGKARRIPNSVGGHRAHPPKGTDYSKKINKKEWKAALASAIAATSQEDLILARGHKIAGGKLPMVVEDSIQEVKKTQDLVNILKTLGLEKDLERGKTGVSILIMIERDEGIVKAAGNIPGIDVATLNDVSVELLAPGTHAGRLTLWSESVIKKLSEDGSA